MIENIQEAQPHNSFELPSTRLAPAGPRLLSARLRHLGSPWYLMAVMDGQGRRPVLTASELRAALSRSEVNSDDVRERLLLALHSMFYYLESPVPQGLETLPLSWLAGLPQVLHHAGLSLRCDLPCLLASLTFGQSVLCVRFTAEPPSTIAGLSAFDRFRIAANLSLYPNLWRPLKRALKVHVSGEATYT